MSLRRLEIARAGWGVAMLFTPRLVLAHVHRVDTDTRSVLVARVLGARQLAQAVLSGVEPSPEVLAMGVWVDAVHASSAVGLAVLDRSRVRAGVLETLLASGWAAAGYLDLRNAAATPPRHDRRRDALARLVLGVVPGGHRLGRLAGAAREEHS